VTDQLPLLIRHLLGFYAIDMLAMGRTSGALAALADGPGTVDDIAARAGLDHRNAGLWLRAMSAAGHAHHDDGVFSLTDESATLLGPDFPIDLGAVLDFVHASFAEPLRAAVRAMHTGAGVPPSAYADLGAAAGGVNTRLYGAVLVDEWIGSAPGLRERLEAGGRIADIACGNADAAALMAAAFPRASVHGYDPGTPEGAHADAPNLSIVRETTDALPTGAAFDLVTCLDAFHHLGDVASVSRQVHDALREDGVFLVAETAMSGDVEVDNADPFSLIAHAAGLMYCMQENLANGGDGSTPSLGLGWVEDALTAAGFRSVTQHDSETGYRIFLAVR
jgi:SAM-dependent methyltransferase